MKRIKRGTPRHDEPWTWLALRVVNGAFRGMTPVFGQVLELGEGQIAMLMSATILGGAVLQWPFGHLSDRSDRRTMLAWPHQSSRLAG